MPAPVKLTPAQAKIYADLERGETFECIDTWKPALALIKAGLVEHRELRSGRIRLWLAPKG